MTKLEMAEILVSSPVWEGIKDAHELARRYTKQEIEDAYDYLDFAEEDYFNNLYGERGRCE